MLSFLLHCLEKSEFKFADIQNKSVKSCHCRISYEDRAEFCRYRLFQGFVNSVFCASTANYRSLTCCFRSCRCQWLCLSVIMWLQFVMAKNDVMCSIYCVSKNFPQFAGSNCQTLTDFQNSFTGWKEYETCYRILNTVPPYLRYVAALKHSEYRLRFYEVKASKMREVFRCTVRLLKVCRPSVTGLFYITETIRTGAGGKSAMNRDTV